jgi:alpha-L-fucosidase
MKALKNDTVSAVLLVVLFFSITSFNSSETDPPQPVYPVPSAAQMAWYEMGMNAFIHFTVNTFTDLEWGMGSESTSLFNPTAANPVQWTEILSDAGFKGVILTCKHHDGFCLWPSKYSEHTIQNSPYKGGKGDLVKELSDACRLSGLKFGVYLSPWDRNNADYGKPAYIEYYRNQLRELFTQYGPVFEMWFDGANGGTGHYGGTNEKRTIDGRTYYDWPGTLELARKIQPDVLFFSDAGPGVRWVGNEEGIAGITNWAMINPDTLYAGKPGINKLLNEGSENGTQWIPAETNTSIRPGWFFHETENDKVKTPEQLFDIYLTSVGRGSVLLLNVPPDRRGLINENDQKSLQGFHELLQKEFKTNLAMGAKVLSSGYRGNAQIFDAGKTTDGNKETYWATNDDTKTGWIEIDLADVQKVKYVIIQEYIKLGQRVRSFSIDIWKDGRWKEVGSGTTVGYKRILQIEPETTDKIRVSILDSRACPVISNIEIY